MKKYPHHYASLIIIECVILGLFSLDIDNPCVWAVAGESGLPSMRKLLLTSIRKLISLVVILMNLMLFDSGINFFPCKIESKHFTSFVGLGAFVSGPCLLFFVHDLRSWHVEFTTKMKSNQVVFLCFSPWMLISPVPERAFLSFIQWGSHDYMEMACDN